MSLVIIRNVAGTLTRAEKDRMIHDVTEAVVRTKGEGNRGGVWVLLEEVASGDWGVGALGRGLTTEDVLTAERTGKPTAI